MTSVAGAYTLFSHWPFINFQSLDAVHPEYLHGEMQPFLSQGQYSGASLKESRFPCVR